MSITEYRDGGPQSPRNATIVERETWSFWASEVCYVYSSITRNSSLSLQTSGVTGRGTLSEMSQPSTDELSPQISNLNSPYEPPDVRWHLYLCGFGRGEDGLEVHTRG